MRDATRSARPFADLTPQVVLDAAELAGFETDGRLFALNSYENRVYQLGTPDGALVLKFYRPGRWTDAQIGEEHEFAAELAGAELPVAAPLEVQGDTLVHFRGHRFAVFPWMAGRAPEPDAPGAREILGRTIARMHALGALRNFRFRPALTVERLGTEAREYLLGSDFVPAELFERYAGVSERLLERVEAIFAEVGPLGSVRLHGDCHLGNLLWAPTGPVFVDLDDCVNGPRIQDLWMLLSGDSAEQQRQWADLLEGYAQFADFDFRELRLVEPLRALRMMHHAAWLAQRWSDPAFPRAFPWFGEPRFWERHIADLLEQLAAVDDPPLLQR